MKQQDNYILAYETLAAADAAIVAKLPQLYTEEGERVIVEHVLIPQLRVSLNSAFQRFNKKRNSSGAVIPAQMDSLCAAVDTMLIEQRELLDTEGLLRPVLEEVDAARASVRAGISEEFRQAARAALAEHKITDRNTMLACTQRRFKATSFGEFGKGTAFATAVLGKYAGDPGLNVKGRIADALGWPSFEEDELVEKQLEAMAAHGITDRKSLMAFGTIKFSNAQFPPFGSGIALAGMILGKPTKSYVTGKYRNAMADKLGWPKIAKENKDEKRAKFVAALAKHGITDRFSLLLYGPRKFTLIFNAPSIGKGCAFVGAVLGRTVYGPVRVAQLHEMADRLGWKQESKAVTIERYKTALAAHGIKSRRSLLAVSVNAFPAMEFPPFGKGGKFACAVLAENVPGGITKPLLKKVADKLGWKEKTPAQEKRAKKEALAEHRIVDRATLMAFGANHFTTEVFGEYGTGRMLAREILGDEDLLTVHTHDLETIADYFNWKGITETAERKRQLDALRAHGMVDYESIVAFPTNLFADEKFPPYGGGLAFASRVLGRSVKPVSRDIREEIAMKLNFPPKSEIAQKREVLELLAGHKITDRKSLIRVGSNNFGRLKFARFGKGRALISAFCGYSEGGKLHVSNLHEFADALGWE